MGDREIPDNCPECGGGIRLRDELEKSLGAEQVFRCEKGCSEYKAR